MGALSDRIVILGLGVVWRGQFQRLPLKTLLYLAGLGAIGITFHQGLQSSGLVTAQASTTAWIVASTPVFIALLGWLFLKERVTWLKAGGIILAAAGVLMILGGGDALALFRGMKNPGQVIGCSHQCSQLGNFFNIVAVWA
jgi:drug/metabolite transporter (DMT)-like permease